MKGLREAALTRYTGKGKGRRDSTVWRQRKKKEVARGVPSSAGQRDHPRKGSQTLKGEPGSKAKTRKEKGSNRSRMEIYGEPAIHLILEVVDMEKEKGRESQRLPGKRTTRKLMTRSQCEVGVVLKASGA